jgi:hypothetical protein
MGGAPIRQAREKGVLPSAALASGSKTYGCGDHLGDKDRRWLRIHRAPHLYLSGARGHGLARGESVIKF